MAFNEPLIDKIALVNEDDKGQLDESWIKSKYCQLVLRNKVYCCVKKEESQWRAKRDWRGGVSYAEISVLVNGRRVITAHVVAGKPPRAVQANTAGAQVFELRV
jgi:hypothetical protein